LHFLQIGTGDTMTVVKNKEVKTQRQKIERNKDKLQSEVR
jgi:hypothetical protein